LITATAAVPADARAAAGIVAVNCVELTNVVVTAVLPNVTIEAATKFVPLTVSMKAAPPTVALFGEIEVIVGTGELLTVEVAPLPQPVRAKTAARIVGARTTIRIRNLSAMLTSLLAAPPQL
jgi:hypothetical protein